MSHESSEWGSDFGEVERDRSERELAETALDDPTDTDNEPWSPPERQPRGAELAANDPGQEETIDQRILQEEPEEGTAYGAPDNEAGDEPVDMVGGDDPDAIPAETDVLGVPAWDEDDERLRDDPFGGPEKAALHEVDDPR
ncbi:hypothetical protein [Aestuariimicrobium kwangyangense]|uniref:hypothetical protein n=1 Tax=Aestuariimicrobium kwangyangense TaxID=396389 RepID=UPI0003B41EA7|nr:hypothetical protein [Aestuariimicrobium kwangyangense]